MDELWMDVDAALSEVPVNLFSLIDDTDFKTREESVTFNQAGLDLLWNFITSAGSFTQTAVTPTDTAGNYDWVNQGNGMYTIEIPASGGASINNNTEGFGWFSGFATGILPWRGPVIGFRAAGLNDGLVEGTVFSLFLSILDQSTGQLDSGSIGTSVDTYQAKVVLLDDDSGATDLYLVTYFKNGEPITSGITSPTIQIIKASDGTDLVASGALTEIGSLGMYKKAETTNRVVDGSGYIAKVQATIASATRTWLQPVGRDS